MCVPAPRYNESRNARYGYTQNSSVNARAKASRTDMTKNGTTYYCCVVQRETSVGALTSYSGLADCDGARYQSFEYSSTVDSDGDSHSGYAAPTSTTSRC